MVFTYGYVMYFLVKRSTRLRIDKAAKKLNKTHEVRHKHTLVINQTILSLIRFSYRIIFN